MERKVAANGMMSGSVAEIPLKYVLSNVSDLDHLTINYGIFAMPYNAPLPETLIGSVVRIDANDVHPGFARLRHDTSGICIDRVSVFTRTLSHSGPAATSQLVTPEELTEISSTLEDESQLTLDNYSQWMYSLPSIVPCGQKRRMNGSQGSGSTSDQQRSS